MARCFTCLINSTGKVREYLAEHRCTSLHRELYAVGDGRGNAAVISIARVGFPSKGDAEGCEKVEKVQGSGDITPLGGALLGLAHLKFSGHHYQSRIDGKTMIVAETGSAEDPSQPGRKAQWILDMAHTAKSWPLLRGIIWFQAGKRVNYWRIDSSQSSLNAYVCVGHDPAFGGTGPTCPGT